MLTALCAAVLGAILEVGGAGERKITFHEQVTHNVEAEVTASSSELAFKTAASPGQSPATHMVVTSAGKLGIGTTSPTAKLHVVETTGEQARFSNGTNNYITVGYDSLNVVGGAFYVKTAGNEKLRIDPSGSIRVAAGGALEWWGGSRAWGDLTGPGEILGGNLLSNGGFENGITGWTGGNSVAAGPTSGDTCSNGYGVHSSGSAFEGSGCGRVNNCGQLYQDVMLLPGGKYTLSARARTQAVDSSDSSDGRLRVIFAANNSDFAWQICRPNHYDTSPNLNKWSLCTVFFTVPDVADQASVSVRISVEARTYTHAMFFDNVMLSRGHAVQGFAERFDYSLVTSGRRLGEREQANHDGQVEELHGTVKELRAANALLEQRVARLERLLVNAA